MEVATVIRESKSLMLKILSFLRSASMYLFKDRFFVLATWELSE